MAGFDQIIIRYVLNKTLKGIQVVRNSVTERFFNAPGPRTKYFKHFFLSFNKQYYYCKDFTSIHINIMMMYI